MLAARASTPASKSAPARSSARPRPTSRSPQSANTAPLRTNDGGSVGYSSGNRVAPSGAAAPAGQPERARQEPLRWIAVAARSRRPCPIGRVCAHRCDSSGYPAVPDASDTKRRLRVVTLVDRLGTSGGGERLAMQIATRLDRERFESWYCVSRWVESASPPAEEAEAVAALREAGVRVVGLGRRSSAAVWSWWPLV